ncbi:MAG: GFA family protein [Proteobacteria bacterium]|nr:GFA family protein [Pseudomonadota bacterium]MBI3500027.1 GFA family protein [Pseudomonadota bacterium]
MTTRQAACSCGQLRLACQGEPVRISMCHCLDCQRRTGSAFGAQARFRREQILEIEGRASEFVRVADSGNKLVFRFCPNCGSTVYWENDGVPRFIAVAMGAFGDPSFPPPRIAVYESRAHSWALAPAGMSIERQSGDAN